MSISIATVLGKQVRLALGVMLAVGAGATVSAMECGARVADGVRVAFGEAIYVKFKLEPAPPALGDLFVVKALVCSRAHARLDGMLSADAVMPAHGHGMNYAVKTSAAVNGAAMLEGFLWQMPGLWRMPFRLEAVGATYRAAYDYEFAAH